MNISKEDFLYSIAGNSNNFIRYIKEEKSLLIMDRLIDEDYFISNYLLNGKRVKQGKEPIRYRDWN